MAAVSSYREASC